MKHIRFWISFLVLLSGCVKEVDWTINQPQTDFIVVDAILTDRAQTQTIVLTKPVTELNMKPVLITGAEILVSNEDSTWRFAEDSLNPGHYLSPANFLALKEKNYTLLISIAGSIYSAKATMVEGKVFNPLHYVQNQSDSLFTIDWVASAFSAEESAMWEVLLDWSNVQGYETMDSLNTHARLLFYTLPTLDVSEIFAPEMEQIKFPAGTIITENRYSITSDHAEFARELLLETNWTGGFFNVASANVTTNLSSGARGFFGLCSVTTLSITVTP